MTAPRRADMSVNSNGTATTAATATATTSSATTPSSNNNNHVRVVARIRPLATYEKEKNCRPVVSGLPSNKNGSSPATGPTTEPQVIQVQESNTNTTTTAATNGKRFFELDAVFDWDSTQQDLYVASGAQSAIVDDLFRGYNCTILAYGQTGEGRRKRAFHPF